MANNNQDNSREKELRLVVILMIALFFVIMWLTTQFDEKRRTELYVLCGVLAGAAILYYAVRLILKYKPWKKNRIEKNPFDFDTEIVIPNKEPITGTFVCPSCGASTTIEKELNPIARCRFCHAAMPDLQNIIDMRDNRYHTACNQEIEYKMRLRELQQTRNNRLQEIEKQKELEKERMEYANEQARLKYELEEKQRENENRRAIQRSETAFGIFGGIIILIILIARALSH